MAGIRYGGPKPTHAVQLLDAKVEQESKFYTLKVRDRKMRDKNAKLDNAKQKTQDFKMQYLENAGPLIQIISSTSTHA